MTNTEMRSEFEKLPEIAELIDEHEAFYCEKGNWYLCPDNDQFAESYLDGAWYTYQEQQKRIDAIKALMDADVYHIPTLIREIKGVLK